VVARARLEGARFAGVAAEVAPHLDAVLEPPGARPAFVALDVPIGLPAATTRGGRAADAEARARLGPRGSSVFSAPCRAALDVAVAARFDPGAYFDAAEASATASPDGLRLSKQAFFLLPRIHEVDAHLDARPDDLERVFEVHPELAFLALGGGRDLGPKKTFLGKLARLRALEAAGLAVPEAALALEEDPRVSPDDVLDAFACLWSAARLARGEAERLPAAPETDPRGRPMAIHF
jgi:predicted RNase H-like nuclease